MIQKLTQIKKPNTYCVPRILQTRIMIVVNAGQRSISSSNSTNHQKNSSERVHNTYHPLPYHGFFFQGKSKCLERLKRN
jgi:hypothetical protein